jgi:glyoxylase-like metal-dependent hydrolase (beta-lactamase superfamily II)
MMLKTHIHCSGEAGIFANAYIVETEKSLVAIDATLTVSEARSFRQRIKALGKPLKAVLITHAHPDHVAGISEWLPAAGTPIYAVRKIEQLMRATEAAKRAQWGPVFKDEWIQKWTYPNQIAEDGAEVIIDEAVFEVVETGPGGDCDANSVWIMRAKPVAAFVGDLIFNGTHSYLADGHTAEWLNNLVRVRSLLPDNALIYPGHGEPGDIKLFDSQESYLRAYRQAVAEISGGKALLTDTQKNALVARMKRFLPVEKLAFMIELSAGAVATELAANEKKRRAGG